MAKSIAVLGLGKFGMSLVRSLSEMGADVLAVDKVEAYVQEIANYCSEAICADLANEEDLNKLGLKEMDIVVCAMGESLSDRGQKLVGAHVLHPPQSRGQQGDHAGGIRRRALSGYAGL